MVLDASAVLAWYEDEPGAQIVEDALLRGDGLISSVNLTEVIGKLVGKAIAPENEVIPTYSRSSSRLLPLTAHWRSGLPTSMLAATRTNFPSGTARVWRSQRLEDCRF